MISVLEKLDKILLLELNGAHTLFWDSFMWMVSDHVIWIGLYFVIIISILIRWGYKELFFLLLLIIGIVLLNDFISTGIFKPLFKRLRPTRDEEICHLIHTVAGMKGNLYGFISIHASNVFALATFIHLLFKSRNISIFIIFWATLVCISRVYLGVHYPGDILGGAIVGISLGWVIYKLYLFLRSRIPILNKQQIEYKPVYHFINWLIPLSVFIQIVTLLMAANYVAKGSINGL
jgi:undecaprenyl-diphosphatase